jgi:hypothetical protein
MSETRAYIPPSQWTKQGREPKGYKFYSGTRKQDMMLVFEGPWKDWLVYKHPDGQWVSLRKATERDLSEISRAVATIHHAK